MLLPLCHLIHTTLYKNIEPFQFTMLENRCTPNFEKQISPPKMGPQKPSLSWHQDLSWNWTTPAGHVVQGCETPWSQAPNWCAQSWGRKFLRPTNQHFFYRFSGVKIWSLQICQGPTSRSFKFYTKQLEGTWTKMTSHGWSWYVWNENEAKICGRTDFSDAPLFEHHPMTSDHLIPPIVPPKRS